MKSRGPPKLLRLCTWRPARNPDLPRNRPPISLRHRSHPYYSTLSGRRSASASFRVCQPRAFHLTTILSVRSLRVRIS